MKLDLLCVLFIGYFTHISNAAGKDKDVHIKIHVPELIHKHSHQHTVYKNSPGGYDENNYDSNGHKHAPIVTDNGKYSPVNKYDDIEKYPYNPEKKYKPKHKKSGKKKSKKQKKKKYGDDKDFKQILENYDTKPEKNDDFGFDNGGFKKSVHTEHYEVKKINPNARFPDEKYIIQGAYKVQETDPWGYPTTSFHEYDSPISKIAASILSKYDYTNFKPGESDEYHKEKEQNDHENFENDSNLGSYNDYDNKKKKSQDYNKPSSHANSEHNDGHNYTPDYGNYGTQKQSQVYSNPTSYNNNDGRGKITQYNYDIPKANNNGKDYEKSAGYEDFVQQKQAHYEAPFNLGAAQSKPEGLHSKQGSEGNKNQKLQSYTGPNSYGHFHADDSKHVGNLKKHPSETEYVPTHDHESVQRELEYEFEKEFGHLVHPGHSAELTEPHYDYDGEWQKHLIDYVYGPDHAASNKFVHKVRPHTRRA